MECRVVFILLFIFPAVIATASSEQRDRERAARQQNLHQQGVCVGPKPPNGPSNVQQQTHSEFPSYSTRTCMVHCNQNEEGVTSECISYS